MQRVTRDLHDIADQAPISSAARDTIQTRVEASFDEREQEAVMFTRNERQTPRRAWGTPGAIAIAAATVLVVAGIVVLRADDDDLVATDPAPTVTADDDVAVTAPPATTPDADATMPAVPAVTEPAVTEPPAPTSPEISVPDVDQVEQLAALPWASPDDAYDDPIDAVTAFVGFVDRVYSSQNATGFADVTIGEFLAGDQRSGEVTFVVNGSDNTISTTVSVRQAGPDDYWWVVGASSETLTIDEPGPDSVVTAPMDYFGTNHVMSGSWVMLHIYAATLPEPLTGVGLTGGGVFALGDFWGAVGPESDICDPLDGFSCDWQAPKGAPGTLVFVSAVGVTTVPIVFAD
jgi:hypothetical protein